MGLPGTTDNSVYEGLKDILGRQPEVKAITYEPDSIVKQFLRAPIYPGRVVPPTGPNSPTLDVKWRFTEDEQYYRIHYADPNTGFNCGWHRDEDHPEFGPVHFQYEYPVTGDSDHERSQFSKVIPAEILWIAVERLFENRIPMLTDEE